MVSQLIQEWIKKSNSEGTNCNLLTLVGESLFSLVCQTRIRFYYSDNLMGHTLHILTIIKWLDLYISIIIER